METKKIRIGNDISLAVDLRQYIGGNHLREREVYNPDAVDFENIDNNPFVNKVYEVYTPNQYGDVNTNAETIQPSSTAIGIRSIKAFLINTSMEAAHEEFLKKKTRFIARFPIEPCFDCFRSTGYNVCNSGYPTWRAYPHRFCATPYHGYGLRPEWDGIYKPFPKGPGFEYKAIVRATAKQNVVEVVFPAAAQRFTGVYKLVVVAQVYAPGYNYNNLKTITVDMPNVFELVKTTDQGIDTGIEMTVNQVCDVLTNIDDTPQDVLDDIYVNESQTSFNGNNIQLMRTDGIPVTVDLSDFTAWYDEEE